MRLAFPSLALLGAIVVCGAAVPAFAAPPAMCMPVIAAAGAAAGSGAPAVASASVGSAAALVASADTVVPAAGVATQAGTVVGTAAAGTTPTAGTGDEEPTMERAIDRAFVATVVGAPAGKPLRGAELETRTHEVGLLLRCPVCQGSSVADSPSSTAINMKNEVRDLLAEGYDQPQILAWFEASYGQFVLMQPKAEGLNMLVWLGPGIVLLAGLALVIVQVRKSMRGESQPDREDATVRPVDPELESYLRDARALAFGDAAYGSGGTSPAGRAAANSPAIADADGGNPAPAAIATEPNVQPPGADAPGRRST